MQPSQPRTDDPIGVTLASIASGATAGGSVLIASTMVVRLPHAGQPDETNLAAGVVLTAGLLAGMGTAVTVAFRSSRLVVDLWRRAVTGAIALFGAAIISIIAMPLEMVAGVPGLALLLVILIVAFTKTHRIVTRATPPL